MLSCFELVKWFATQVIYHENKHEWMNDVVWVTVVLWYFLGVAYIWITTMYAALKSPGTYFEQMQKLDRARKEDYLNHAIQIRPIRDVLVQKHILEGELTVCLPQRIPKVMKDEMQSVFKSFGKTNFPRVPILLLCCSFHWKNTRVIRVQIDLAC